MSTTHRIIDCSLSPIFPCDRAATVTKVRTDFWIQNSRLFETFLQDDNFFFLTQGYQIGDQYSLRTDVPLPAEKIHTKKTQEQSFLHGVLQTQERDWIRFDQNGKHFTSKALVVALKKKINKLKTFYHFSRLFPGLENCWANFKTSRIQDSVRTLCYGWPS